MDYLSHNVSENLKRLRQSKGMSLDQVAEQTGVSKSMLAQIEKDLRKTVDEKGAENSSMHEPYKIMADSIYKFIMAEIEKCPAADADMI